MYIYIYTYIYIYNFIFDYRDVAIFSFQYLNAVEFCNELYLIIQDGTIKLSP